MPVVSMQLEEKERKEMAEPSLVGNMPKYPHGLRINLGPEELEKLGMGQKVPEVGKVKSMVAKVEVVAVRNDRKEGDENSLSVSLQITDMGFGDEIKQESDSTRVFYGGEGDHS